LKIIDLLFLFSTPLAQGESKVLVALDEVDILGVLNDPILVILHFLNHRRTIRMNLVHVILVYAVYLVLLLATAHGDIQFRFQVGLVVAMLLKGSMLHVSKLGHVFCQLQLVLILLRVISPLPLLAF
jgi:hypothetical protein